MQKSTALIEIDLIPYEIVANTQLIIIAGSIVHNISYSDDSRISYIIFKHEVYDEATAQLEPSFTFFLKGYIISAPKKEKWAFMQINYTSHRAICHPLHKT